MRPNPVRAACAIAFVFAAVGAPSMANAETVIDGGNVINQIWTPTASPYRLRGDVTVPVGAFLYIEPGTEIVVDTGDQQGSGIDATRTELRVHGVLHADGTAQAPIRIHGNGTMDSWYGLVSYFGPVQTRLHHVQIADARIGITSGSQGTGLDVRNVVMRQNRIGIQIEVGTPHLQDVSMSAEWGLSSPAADAFGIRVFHQSAPTTSRITIAGYFEAVYVYDASITLNNCVLRDNWSMGVTFFPYVGRRLEVRHCTIVRSGNGVHSRTVPFSVLGATILIENSIIASGALGVVNGNPGHAIPVRYSNVWGNAGDYREAGPGEGTISANPQFVSRDDLRLRPSSVSIDTCPSGLDDDRDGAARPANGDGLGDALWDMGAYEHAATARLCGDGVIGPGETCDDGARNGEYGRCNTTCSGPGARCGDSVVNGPEQCDDGNDVNTDACLATCRLATCGDGVIWEGAEQCDDGNRNDNDTCTRSCASAACGDGIIQFGIEQCDDGNQVDTDSCRRTCRVATCGDSVTWDGVEQCDDGNRVGTDDCTNACTEADCGDGVIHVGHEQCDDGNQVDTDACRRSCHVATCGDDTVWAGVEQCDDGNRVNTDACTSACANAACGDGAIHTGVEQCDDANDVDTDACRNGCRVAVCGDGAVWANVEQCDDGNRVTTDACTNACADAACGDGVIHSGIEQCDDANDVNTDACVDECLNARCGDGHRRDGVEACDDGNDVNTDACTRVCAAPTCGDGFVQTGEQCDDANTDDGDACLRTCLHATCGDGNVQRGREACDDSNTDDGDGCSATCTIEPIDAGVPDATVDAGVDATVDAGVDATVDAGVDATVDAGVDATVDAGVDATVDAGVDAGVDAPIDAGAAGDPTVDATVGPDRPEREDGSCQAGSSNAAGAALLIASLLTAMRRRRHR